MLLTVGLSVVNTALLLVLLAIYGKIVVKTRAAHSLGLVLFATLLLMQNLVSIYAYVTMNPYFESGVLPYLSAIAALELGGLIVLLRVTL
jgi:uncharacterized protein involved in response to NO